MKRFMPLLYFIVLIVVFAQEVIENPKTPINDHAGRVLKVEEEFRIDSQGEGYYFNVASDLRIDISGNIYICDSGSSQQRSHLLKFSPGGRFIKDLYRQGEGPGEIQSAFGFVLSDSDVFLYDWMKRKMVVRNPDGIFKEEFKTKSVSLSDFIGVFKDWLVFTQSEYPTERKTSKLYDVKNVIFFVSKDGQTEREFHTFLNKRFFVSPAQGWGMMPWDPFIATMGDGLLFVCCSSEYLIEVLNLESGEITARFKREFPRVRHKQENWEKDFESKFNAPRKKFEHDIEDLIYDQGRLWVKTSTKDGKKGVLFDLFDSKGQFLDSFYINIKGRILKIDGDFLYVAESDVEELPVVVKYRIINLASLH